MTTARDSRFGLAQPVLAGNWSMVGVAAGHVKK
jgi:hypothetical protein